MNAATLCPECLAIGIIATDTGPTCQHTRNENGWWPSDFATANQNHGMSEPQRLAWIESRRVTKARSNSLVQNIACIRLQPSAT